MRAIKIAGLCALLAGLAGCTSVDGKSAGPDIMTEVASWPTTPASDKMGQVTGIAVDSHNHVFVFHRASRAWTEPFPTTTIRAPTIFMFDGDSGKLLARWGANRFIMPHGLSVDRDDNIWATDVGLEQVLAFTHDGELLRSIGTPRVAGNDHQHFGRPADVAFDQDRMLMADGYTNTRVAVFGRDGGFQRALGGTRGAAPGELDLPHGIAVDAGRIYVADRENSRLQIWSPAGEVLAVWPREKVGRPYAVAVSGKGLVAVIDGGDQPDDTAALVRLFHREGSLLGSHDTRRPNDQANLGHDIAFGRDGAIYVGDAWAKRVTKLVPKR